MLNGLKVVTAAEMARIEKIAYDEGYSPATFMENAGRSIAEATVDFIQAERLEKKVTLLVGKGNNGGDALVAGYYLLEKGFQVSTHFLCPLNECTTLSQSAAKRFAARGGTLSHDAPFEGVIIDGLVGTGFKGTGEGALNKLIERANLSGLPILAVDIPSGLNGTTGEVDPIAIKASATFFLGLPKIGFFIGNGWDHVGKLVACDFGLPAKIVREAKAIALLPSETSLRELIPPIKRSRHKYESGYLLVLASSAGMEGAGILASYAALRSGAGIVRLFYPPHEMGSTPLEIIKEPMDDTLENVFEQSKRARALLVGPGLGRSEKIKEQLSLLFSKQTLPCVIDADALYFFHTLPCLPKEVILTPHKKEMERLLDAKPQFSNCQALCEEKKVTLILKGGPTVIFHPFTLPLIMIHGDPGMATAGSGDVLGGVVASLLAQQLPAFHAAALGVYLHGIAGEKAAQKKTSHCMIASDIIEYLPEAFKKLS